MNFVTYNIRLGIQLGLPAVADVLRPLTPDIVALQEVGNRWTMGPAGDSTRELGELLSMRHQHFPAILDPGPAHYGHALLSRHPFTQHALIDLPQSIDEPRRLAHIHLDAPHGRIHLLRTHLSHREVERPPQGEVLADLAMDLDARGEHVVIMGDLNEERPSPWLERLAERFEDADAQKKRRTFPSDAPVVRIDYLWTNRGSWHDVEVIDDTRTSDHRPLKATWAEAERG